MTCQPSQNCIKSLKNLEILHVYSSLTPLDFFRPVSNADLHLKDHRAEPEDLTGHQPLSSIVGKLDSVDAAEVAEHVLLVEAGTAGEPPPLELSLQLRLSTDRPVGKEPDGTPHAAGAQCLLHLASVKSVSTTPLDRHGIEPRLWFGG